MPRTKIWQQRSQFGSRRRPASYALRLCLKAVPVLVLLMVVAFNVVTMGILARTGKYRQVGGTLLSINHLVKEPLQPRPDDRKFATTKDDKGEDNDGAKKVVLHNVAIDKKDADIDIANTVVRKITIDHGPLYEELGHEDVDNVFERFLKAESSAAFVLQGTTSPLVVIVAGASNPDQCAFAANLGYRTYCFEPSPKSYDRLVEKRGSMPIEVERRLVLYPEAASGITGRMLFRSTGGPGDHVGQYDMWRMEQKLSEADSANPKMGEILQVKTKRLDEVVYAQNAGQRQWKVHLLKVMTNGHEANVFAGLKNSLNAGAVKYILFQFWPRGLDLMKGTERTCLAGTGVINHLVSAGYSLHALQIVSHPKAPVFGRKQFWNEEQQRPAGSMTPANAKAYCQWYLDFEQRHPSPPGKEEYMFGYWSHFVAVAPGAELPAEVHPFAEAK